MKVRAAEPQSKGRGGPFWCSWAWCWVITCRTPMNEALELCRLCDERTLGLVLALLRRARAPACRVSSRTWKTAPSMTVRWPAMFCRRINKLMLRFKTWQPGRVESEVGKCNQS